MKPYKVFLHNNLNIYDLWLGRVFHISDKNYNYDIKNNNDSSNVKLKKSNLDLDNYFLKVKNDYSLLNEEKNQNIFDKNSSPKIILASRIKIDKFEERPYVNLDSNKVFHSKTLLLSSVSLANNTFFKTRYIYGFGNTEDIPVGSLIEIIAGKEFGEFKNRLYIGLKLAKAKFFTNPFSKKIKLHNLNYLYSDIIFGTYFNDSDLSQTAIKHNINFISRLFSMSQYFSNRNFINLSYIIGFNRFPNEFLKTKIVDRNSNGFENLDIETIKGSQRISLTYESVFFTPWHLYGFKLTPFIFSDFAVMNSIKESSNLFKSHKFFTGLGSGIRLKNERLIFETIQFDFTYHPILYPGMDHFTFNLKLEYKLNFNNFIGGKPSIITYE